MITANADERYTADNITDEQIRELQATHAAIVWDAMCHTFRTRYCGDNCKSRRLARARCAEILNARGAK